MRHLVQFSRSLARIQVKNVIERKRYMCTKCSDDDKFIVKQQISFVDTKPAASPLKTVELQIDWDEEMQAIYDDEERENSRSVLAPVEDENSIYAEPMIHPSFNLAAYVQKSDTLQQLMKLGVELYKLDRLETGEFIVNLDFKRDIEPHILFLNKNIGIPIELMGKYLTQNPNILKESLDDIQTRVNYLELKRFTRDEIVSIVTRNAIWLNKSTRDIDELLGFFQNHFKLNGNQVRLLTVTYPRLITHNLDEVQKISFSVREECCFEDDEVKQLLLKCPKLWMLRKCWKVMGLSVKFWTEIFDQIKKLKCQRLKGLKHFDESKAFRFFVEVNYLAFLMESRFFG